MRAVLFRWAGLLLLLGVWAGRAHGQAAPSFTITAASAFLRDTPSTSARATHSVFQGETYSVIGRTANNEWLQLDYPRPKGGTWVLATVGQVGGSLADVPIITLETATPDPASRPATAPPAPPTPTPTSTDPGDVCVRLYLDQNGDGLAGPEEPGIEGGQLDILEEATGVVVQTHVTTRADASGYCFTGVPAGRYLVTAGAPAGYNATTEPSIRLSLLPGERQELMFGAQAGAGARLPSTAPDWAGLVAGLILILLALGLLAGLLVRR